MVIGINAVKGKSVNNTTPLELEAMRGMLVKSSDVLFQLEGNTPLVLRGIKEAGRGTSLLRHDWTFESMGIGGLDNEFSDIFRRAFASFLPRSSRNWVSNTLKVFSYMARPAPEKP